MAGFGKFVFVGEFYSQSIVNILWYRSDTLLWLEGNVFENAQSVTDTVADLVAPLFQGVHTADYTLLRVECTPYDNAFVPLIGSPLIKTLNVAGVRGALETNGAATACTVGLKCGPQVQINGVGTSKRNRGYVSVGPLADAWVDNFGHIVNADFLGELNGFADGLTTQIEVILPPAQLTPIRIHEKFLPAIGPVPKILLWRTYSDIVGYTLPRMATWRKSRQPEA